MVNWAFLISTSLGVYATFSRSMIAGLIYSAIIVFTMLIIVAVYCTKCSVKRSGCSHAKTQHTNSIKPKMVWIENRPVFRQVSLWYYYISH